MKVKNANITVERLPYIKAIDDPIRSKMPQYVKTTPGRIRGVHAGDLIRNRENNIIYYVVAVFEDDTVETAPAHEVPLVGDVMVDREGNAMGWITKVEHIENRWSTLVRKLDGNTADFEVGDGVCNLSMTLRKWQAEIDASRCKDKASPIEPDEETKRARALLREMFGNDYPLHGQSV